MSSTPPPRYLLPWGVAVVRGRSMEPTLREGDRLLVRWVGPRLRSRLRRSGPGQAKVVGRLAVVLLPGGRPLSVKRITRRLPEGWWVERDNPETGTDSWLVGAIAPDDVRGLVVCRLRPRPFRLGRRT